MSTYHSDDPVILLDTRREDYKSLKKTYKIIYDTHNVESVILAALIATYISKQTGVFPVVRTINMPGNTPADEILYVGEHTENMAILAAMFKSKTTVRHVTDYIEEIGLHPECVDSDYLSSTFSSTLNISSLFKYGNAVQPENTDLFRLSQAMALFNSRSRDMAIYKGETPKNVVMGFARRMEIAGLYELGLIYANWKAAKDAIALKQPFELVQSDIPGYLKYLKILKNHIECRYQRSVVSTNQVKMLTMNAHGDDIPWLTKFLSIRYKIGMVYEVSNDAVMVSTWSQGKLTLEDMLIFIKRMVNTNYSVYFMGSPA